MRLSTVVLATLMVFTGLTVATSASQASAPAAALVRPAVTSKWVPAKKNPYGSLFTPTRQVSTQAGPTPPAPGVVGKPEIKCGMTMIPADPSIDPLMAVSRPPDGPRFTIRAIEPSICR